jgi:hypothetical protein
MEAAGDGGEDGQGGIGPGVGFVDVALVVAVEDVDCFGDRGGWGIVLGNWLKKESIGV